MNHRQANMLNLKDWKELLIKHPDNYNLKKWVKRAENAEASRKKKGHDPKFLIAYEAYNKRGHKINSSIQWEKRVLDPDLVIACIPIYLAECKKLDRTIKHMEGWLEGERWEAYEAQALNKPAETKRASAVDGWIKQIEPWLRSSSVTDMQVKQDRLFNEKIQAYPELKKLAQELRPEIFKK